MTNQVSRRGFLKTAAASAATLVIGLNSQGLIAAGVEKAVTNPFVSIDHNGVVTIILKHFEMGQGTSTGLTTLIAEELDADWASVKTEFAPSDNEKYKNLLYGSQGTGGSSAIANSYLQYRKAGATARDLLVRAAAKAWAVDKESISIEKGVISAGNQSGGFADFIQIASTLEPLAEPQLKSPADFKLIGKLKLPRKDSIAKTDGTATFAMDLQLPGMVTVVILRSPKFAGTVQSFDASEAKKVAGFINALTLPNKAGLAVYGKNTWAAFQSRKAIKVVWDFSQAEIRDSAQIVQAHRDLITEPQFQGIKGRSTDSLQAAIASSSKTLEAEFIFPFLAHAPMEPLVCVIEPTEKGVRLHDGCQFPAIAHGALSQVLGLSPDQVEISTVYAGGSFGRRATPVADYQVEAAMAFVLLGQKTPVKLVWSREDDIKGGFYRPMVMHKAQIGLDDKGNILAWDHRTVSKSIMKGGPFEPFMIHDGVDHSMVEGIPDSLYKLPNMALGVSYFESPISVLWWRSVGHSHTAFVMESLLDMVAHETQQDPIELRLSLLDTSKPKQSRMAGVIKAARDLSGWQKDQKRGFASHFSFNSYVAVVADVSMDGNKTHVDKLYIAVDCGVAVNPDVIKAQMEGGAGYGLGAILRNEITFKEGEVVQSNFPDYAPLRIHEMPEIEVTIIQSAEAPTGVGEPGVPPTGPAVANAIFAVSGQRITDLPLTKSGLEFV